MSSTGLSVHENHTETGDKLMSKLNIREKIGYGLGDTASNIVFQVVINFLVFFYTDVYGISAAAAGTLMLSIRLFDAVTDPLMGGLADRTQTRWGRYRPYLLWLALPYGVLAVLTFTTPDFSPSGKLLYAYVTYALLMTVYTAINIPYSALGGVITGDSEDRSSVQAWRFALAMLGGVLVASTTLPLVEYFGGDDQQKGFPLAMAMLSLVAIACFIACFALTEERVDPVKSAIKQSIFKDIVFMFRNDQWRIIALVTLVLLTSIAMKGGATPFFVKYYLNSEHFVSLFLTVGMAAGIAGALFANWLSGLFCKVTVMKWAAMGTVLFNATIFLVPNDAVMLALVLSAAANFAHMTLTPNIFAAIADTVDYGLKHWNKAAMAMSYSGHLFALKVGIAIGGALTGWLLAATGYQPDTDQAELALNGIIFTYAGGSVIAGLVVCALLFPYKLTRDYMSNEKMLTEEDNH